MVIESSALIAILLQLVTALKVLEVAMVAEARNVPAAGREFDLLLHHARIDIVPMDSVMVEEARRVWRVFGKGNHLAGLNFCDCCALALARVSGHPLLFKGEDFVRAGAPSALGLG